MMVKLIMGAAAGGGLGLGYYKLIGCTSGTCPLTSNPWISSLYGAVMGILVATSFK